MTVAQLIERLSDFDGSLTVRALVPEWQDGTFTIEGTIPADDESVIYLGA